MYSAELNKRTMWPVANEDFFADRSPGENLSVVIFGDFVTSKSGYGDFIFRIGIRIMNY